MRMPTLAGDRAIPFGGSWSTDSVVGLQDSAESVLLEPLPPFLLRGFSTLSQGCPSVSGLGTAP